MASYRHRIRGVEGKTGTKMIYKKSPQTGEIVAGKQKVRKKGQ